MIRFFKTFWKIFKIIFWILLAAIEFVLNILIFVAISLPVTGWTIIPAFKSDNLDEIIPIIIVAAVISLIIVVKKTRSKIISEL